MSGTTGSSRRGRRPGTPDTRSAILAAARTSFAEKGHAGTTIRGVARAAGVDPALVHHYFGSKEDLFLASLALPVDPRERLAPVFEGGPDGAGERLLRVFLDVWDDPALQPSLLALVRGLSEPEGQRLLRDGLLAMIFGPLAEALGIDDPRRRVSLVASQMVGLAMVRYLLAIEPLASLPAEEVVAIYAPTLQRYLTGDLPSEESGRGVSS